MHIWVDDRLFLLQDKVLLVCGERLLVRGVRLDFFGCVDQILVEEDLADVRGACDEEIGEGVVGVFGYFAYRVGEDWQRIVRLASVSMTGGENTVDMGCATNVVAWEDGFELDHAIFVRLLHAAEERCVQVGLVFRVAVSASNDAGIDALLMSA